MKQCRNLRTKYSKILKRDGLFSVSKVISKVYANNKIKSTPFGVLFILEKSGPDRFVAASILIEDADTSIFLCTNPHSFDMLLSELFGMCRV